MPDAVRIGLARRSGNSCSRRSSGTAAMMSTSLRRKRSQRAQIDRPGHRLEARTLRRRRLSRIQRHRTPRIVRLAELRDDVGADFEQQLRLRRLRRHERAQWDANASSAVRLSLQTTCRASRRRSRFGAESEPVRRCRLEGVAALCRASDVRTRGRLREQLAICESIRSVTSQRSGQARTGSVPTPAGAARVGAV